MSNKAYDLLKTWKVKAIPVGHPQISLEVHLQCTFTKALVEGISGKGDCTGKGRITVSMHGLLSEWVKWLTGGQPQKGASGSGFQVVKASGSGFQAVKVETSTCHLGDP